MPDPSSKQSLIATFLATVHGKIIAALTIIVLALGVVAEFVSIATGYQNLRKERAQANALTDVTPPMSALNGPDFQRYLEWRRRNGQ